MKLKRGMGLADARAIHPSIEVMEAEPEADRRLLESLAHWCDRYTPLVALDGEDGLLLDVTGCSHLFGGERGMLDDIARRLSEQGFKAQAGLAGTAGAAWAAARFLGGTIVPHGGEEEVLTRLPLAALRLDPATRSGLESVGLRNIGAIVTAPRAPLVRRFGSAVITRLDQALGRIEEAISPRFPTPPLSVERQFADPILLIDDIEMVTGQLAESLGRELERRAEGARTLRLTLFRVDGAVHCIDVGASRPLRDPRAVSRLFHERLVAVKGDMDMGCGFELVRLSALATGNFDSRQADLAGDEYADEADLGLFADRVRARLGEQAMLRVAAIESHIPERAVQLLPFAAATQARTDHSFVKERPIRLLVYPEPVDVSAAEVPEGPPLQFRWRRSLHVVARTEGPERIAPEWWLYPTPEVEVKDGENREDKERQAIEIRTASLTRDYFRVEDVNGCRFWLYRESLYRSDLQPRWFMHGLLA